MDLLRKQSVNPAARPDNTLRMGFRIGRVVASRFRKDIRKAGRIIQQKGGLSIFGLYGDD